MTDLLAWQLADSAFPTGGFAHSGGLEAAWQSGEIPNPAALEAFAVAVLEQNGCGMLPLLNAAYRDPSRFDVLDHLADVFLTNPVANRASRVQGRALAATAARIWPSGPVDAVAVRVDAGLGHQGPVMGVVFAALELPLDRGPAGVPVYGGAGRAGGRREARNCRQLRVAADPARGSSRQSPRSRIARVTSMRAISRRPHRSSTCCRRHTIACTHVSSSPEGARRASPPVSSPSCRPTGRS